MSGVPCDPRAPVIVGAGQVNGSPDRADGPIALAVEALRVAGRDSGTGDRLLRRADSARHVATLCWPYSDEAALIAEQLGAAPRETVRTVQIGGDGPQRLVSDTAESIAGGKLDIALLSGAEAVATLRANRQRDVHLDWPDQPAGSTPTRVVGSDRLPSNEAELTVGLMAPVYNYALIETALRGRLGERPDRHMAAVAGLWSRFSEVAAGNPHARLPRVHSPAELLEQNRSNRPVSLPYAKLMTANIQVDQATGLIMCSAEAASLAGVPRERWVFVVAGAHAEEEWFLSERAELDSSPAIRATVAAVLEHADVSVDELGYFDLYSCFPCAVQIAARELGLATDDAARPLTVTGGLTFAGGPGNNYSSHAIATLVDLLRSDPDALGLCTALGWYLTKHACGIYSGRPPARAFRDVNAGRLAERPTPRRARGDYSGLATLEAYTIPCDREGRPEAAVLTALTPDGERALARTTDGAVIDALTGGDPLGRQARFSGADGIVEIGS